MFIELFTLLNFLEIDYHSLSMVSTGCCVHVARIKINIDNQHVTKPLQRYDILPKQPKEKA